MAEMVAANPETARAEIAELRAAFTGWSANAGQVRDNFLTAELVPLSSNLSNLGSIGLRALEYLTDGKPASADWVAQQIQSIEGMEKPVAEVQLAATRPVRILVNALSLSASRPRTNEVNK
jgi:hexosaminidase